MFRDLAVSFLLCVGVLIGAPARADAFDAAPEAPLASTVAGPAEALLSPQAARVEAGQAASPGTAGLDPTPPFADTVAPEIEFRWDETHVTSTAAVVGVSSLGTRLMLLLPGVMMFGVLVVMTGGDDLLDYALAFGGTSLTLGLVDAVVGAGVSLGAYRYFRPTLEPSFAAALLGHAAGGVVSAALLGGVVGGAWMLQAALAEQAAVVRPENLALVSGLTLLGSIPAVMVTLVASVVLPAFGSAWATEKSARLAEARTSIGTP